MAAPPLRSPAGAVEPGDYRVILDFCETEYFNPDRSHPTVACEGTAVLVDFDLHDHVRERTALRTVPTVTVTDGRLDVVLTGEPAAMLAGISAIATSPPPALDAGGHVLVWLDGEPAEGAWHVTARGLETVDAIAFAKQTTDVSYGRAPDGGELWVNFAVPTPGAANGWPTSAGDPATLAERPSRLTIHPTPFNPRTTIALQVHGAGPVTLRVFDVAGRRIRELHTGWLGNGRHEFAWDGRDDRGQPAGSGPYFARATGERWTATRALVLVR